MTRALVFVVCASCVFVLRNMCFAGVLLGLCSLFFEHWARARASTERAHFVVSTGMAIPCVFSILRSLIGILDFGLFRCHRYLSVAVDSSIGARLRDEEQ